MKTFLVLTVMCAGAPVVLFADAKPPKPVSETANTPPPVYVAPAGDPAPGQIYIYDQKPVSTTAAPSGAAGRSYLISPEQAQSIIDRFKEEYKKLGAPRMVICV